MSINLGSIAISNAYVGSSEVAAIYLGGTQIWTSVVTIPIGPNTFKLGGLGGVLDETQVAGKLSGETIDYFVSQSGDIFVSSSTNYQIDNSAFQNDATIVSYIDGGRCDQISSQAFQACSNLVTASFPSATFVGDSAFADCTNLVSASFPSASTIGIEVFRSSGLVTASFPNVTSIPDGAFQSCTSLVTASFPNVTSIGTSSLQGCTSLVTASFPNATANTSNGSIIDIIVTNPGANYTYANVTVSSALGSGVVAYANTSPVGGHGFDPISELGCSHVMYSVEFNGSEDGEIPTDIDFHQKNLVICCVV